MSRTSHLRDSPVTTADTVRLSHGLNIHCRCGHHGTLTPAQIAEAPDTQIYDYKCRFRCTRCGRRGDSDEIEIRVYVADAPFTPEWSRARQGTPPQRCS